MTEELSPADRIAQLEERIAGLEQTVNRLAARGSGISHVFGRNPLVEKYASLGSQVFTTLRAGQVFDDTQGKFFPIVVSRQGDITINTSTNFPTGFKFHDTKNITPIDAIFGMRASARLGVYPDTADYPMFFAVENAPTTAGVTRGIYLYSGTTTLGNPDILTIESTGTRTIYLQTFIMKVKAGIPDDTDFDSGHSGMCVVDTTNSRAYFRVGSTWKYAALT